MYGVALTNFSLLQWSMSNLASFHESPLPKLSIPKDLADVFESVAAAIFVDSGRLDLVWRTFYLLLKDALGKCSPYFKYCIFYSFSANLL